MTIGASADQQEKILTPGNGDSFPAQIPLTKKGQPRKRAPGAGRPRIKLTSDQINLIERLAEGGESQDVIAGIIGVSDDTIRDNFSTPLKKGRANLKHCLLGEAVRRAKSGSDPLLIFLLKSICGLSDRVDITSTSYSDQTIRVIIEDQDESITTN